MNKHLTCAAALIAALALPVKAVVIVDAFTDAGTALTIQNLTSGPFTVSTRTAGIDIIGGEREVTLTKNTGATSVPSDDITLDVGGGYLGVNSAVPVAYGFSVLWDGNGEATATGANDLGLGLNANGTTHLTLKSTIDQLMSGSLQVRLYTTASDYAYFDFGLLAGNDLQFDIPISSFTSVGTGIDLSNINAIELFGIASKPGTDWNLSGINLRAGDNPPPVPETTTAVSATCFALLAGLGYFRRQKIA